MFARCVGLILCAGCQQILGIEDPVVAVDAAQAEVTGRAGVIRVDDQTNGATQEPSATLPRAFTLDGEELVVNTHGDGFAFSLPVDAPYRLVIDDQHEYQLASRHVEAFVARVGHGSGSPITLPTQLTIAVSNASTASYAYIQTSGIRTRFYPLGQTSTIVVPWQSTTPVGGDPVRALSSTDDRVWYNGYTVAGPTAVMTLAGSGTVALANGASDAMAIAATPVALDRCVDIDAGVGAELARVGNVPGSTDPQGAWYVLAIPSPTDSPLGEFVLASGTGTGATRVTYGDPFPAAGHLALLDARVLVDGAQQRTLTYQLLTSIVGCDTVSINGSVEIAGPASVDGRSIATSMILRGPLRSVEWTVRAPGDIDDYLIEIRNVVANRLVRSIRTVARHAALDPTWFSPGESYTITIISRAGVPGAAGGDFRGIRYPHAFSTVTYPAFRYE